MGQRRVEEGLQRNAGQDGLRICRDWAIAFNLFVAISYVAVHGL